MSSYQPNSQQQAAAALEHYPGSDLQQWLSAALTQLKGCRIALLGDLILDGYIYGETIRISREAPVLIVRKQQQLFRLGGAANVAANLAALGVDVRLLACIGQDEAGSQLAALLQQAAIATDYLVPSKDWITPCKTRILAGAQGAGKQQVLRLDDEPSLPLAEQTLLQVQQHLQHMLADIDLLIVSDYGTGLITGSLLAQVQLLAKQGLPCAVDSRYQLAAFQGVYAIKPNLPEAEAIVGFPLTSKAAIEQAGHHLLQQTGSSLCLLTQGKQGMTLFDAHHRSVSIPSVGSQEVTDVTGAGDTVMATFAAGLAAKLSPVHAMYLANCAASVVVQKAGTGVATAAEMMDVALQSQHEVQAWPQFSHSSK